MLDADFNSKYGKILQDYRKKNHLTQENVSEITSLAPRYISQIERGELKGTIKTLLSFCNAYNITPNDLLLDFLDNKNIKQKESYDYKINKLSLRDKEIINDLLEYLLNN